MNYDSVATRTSESPYPWYALKVRTKSELLASSILRRKGYIEFCPTYVDQRRYADRVTTVQAAVFQGYTFCRFDWQQRLPIITSPAVEYAVGFGDVPMPIPDEEILAMQRTVAAGARPAPYLQDGQRVRVEFGPLAGIEGILSRHARKNRLVVSIELLQRAVAVEIAADKVRAIAPILREKDPCARSAYDPR